MVLDESTAKGRAFLLLKTGNRIPAKSLHDTAGYDYRRRVSNLRELGIPVDSFPVKGRRTFDYQIPQSWLSQYRYRCQIGKIIVDAFHPVDGP